LGGGCKKRGQDDDTQDRPWWCTAVAARWGATKTIKTIVSTAGARAVSQGWTEKSIEKKKPLKREVEQSRSGATEGNGEKNKWEISG